MATETDTQTIITVPTVITTRITLATSAPECLALAATLVSTPTNRCVGKVSFFRAILCVDLIYLNKNIIARRL